MNESIRDIAMRLRAGYTEPTKLAEAVLHELGDDVERLKDALREVLPGYVAGMIRSSRNTTFRSAKVTSIQEWFPRWLDQQLHTEAGYKRMRETTRADWIFAAAERESHIAAETVRMNQCTAMAALFDKYPDIQVAADLPQAEVQAVFGKLAA